MHRERAVRHPALPVAELTARLLDLPSTQTAAAKPRIPLPVLRHMLALATPHIAAANARAARAAREARSPDAG